MIQLVRIHEGASGTQDIYRKRYSPKLRRVLQPPLQRNTAEAVRCADKPCVHINKQFGQLMSSYYSLYKAAAGHLVPTQNCITGGPSYLSQCTRGVEPLLWWKCHLVFLWWIIYVREKHTNIVCGSDSERICTVSGHLTFSEIRLSCWHFSALVDMSALTETCHQNTWWMWMNVFASQTS